MAKYKDLSVDGTKDIEPVGGFNHGTMDTTKIKDQSIVSETALNKMATSIPTPFARLFLYDTAFKELNAREHDDKGKAYVASEGEATLYHHLAAECLDLLEFIFEYGNDRSFTINEWVVNADTRLLGADTFDPNDDSVGGIEKKHAKLGKALSDAITNTTLEVASKIYLFKWDGVVVGGTSPYTLVYVSPNWRRKMTAAGLEFHGAAGNQLFAPVQPKSKVFSLSERSADFRKYLYCLQGGYGNEFNVGKPLSNFAKYLSETRANYDGKTNVGRVLIQEYTAIQRTGFSQHLTDDYTPLKRTSGRLAQNEVNVLAIPFFVKKFEIFKDSAYQIEPSVEELPVEKNSRGEAVDMKDQLPLVLSRAALNGSYWWNTPYKPEFLPSVPQDEYYERTLPGVAGRPKYPYLTECDFFEDKIMYVGYTLNTKRFKTCFSGDSPFLLPLKPVFFKYFKTEDLDRLVKVIPTEGPVYASVEVNITIPVQGGEVKFSKTYRKAKGEYVDFPTEGAFKLGIFPFYAYRGEDSRYNFYKILMARTCEVALEFYKNNFVSPLSNTVATSPKIRTSHNKAITEYYTLGTPLDKDSAGADGTFTAIRVVKDGIGGMIVPMFQKAETSTDKYVFCVDFGTANTNVAYAVTRYDNVTGEHRVNGQDIKTLEFGMPSGSQPVMDNIVMLNAEDSEGNAYVLNKYINTEFIPNSIGTNDVKFPIRTIACTRRNMEYADPQLFGDANIAFINEKYDDIKECYKFETDLKWGKNTRALNSAFFREIMWMCKNKVAELGGDPKFYFYFTYPQTMSHTNVNAMAKVWETAACEVRSEANVRKEIETATTGLKAKVLEGVAPWYRALSIQGADIFHTDNFVNVDIGGGSTDIIYVTKPRNNINAKGYSLSIKFAANNLWGDGVSGDATNDNGFLNAFRKHILPNLGEALKDSFKDYEKRATGSADIISFLFSKGNFRMESLLSDDEKLRLPMLIHFASIIYYIARSLAIEQLPAPKHISFSGMGSLYIKNITEDEVILSKIIKAIFNYVQDRQDAPLDDNKSLNALFAKNPKKITAEGGVLMHNASQASQRDKVVKEEARHFYLIQGEEEEESLEIKFDDAEKFKSRTLKELDNFITMFEDAGFRKSVKDVGVDLKFDKDAFMGYLSDGFDLAQSVESANANPDDVIEDTIFFWPLKHAIYMLTREISRG